MPEPRFENRFQDGKQRRFELIPEADSSRAFLGVVQEVHLFSMLVGA